MNVESPLSVAAISYSLSEAMVVASKLEAVGIRTITPDWHYISNDPSLISALGGLRIWVLSEELIDATEIIRDATPDTECANGRMCDNFILRAILGILMALLAVGPPPRRQISLPSLSATR